MKWKGTKVSKYQTTADLATMHLKDKKVLAADVIKLTRNTYELLEQRDELLEALKGYMNCCGLLRMPYEEELNECNKISNELIKKIEG